MELGGGCIAADKRKVGGLLSSTSRGMRLNRGSVYRHNRALGL